MSHRQLWFLVIFTLVLSLGGVFAPQGVYAQRECVSDSDCHAAPDLGAEFRCVQNRCNLPPPIWNSVSGPGLGAAGQVGGFDVQNNSRVRGDLTVGTTDPVPLNTTGNLRTNAIYSRLGEATVDDIWIGDSSDRIRVQGSIQADGRIRGNFTATDGALCTANQILKRNPTNTAWTCAADVTGAGGTAWSGLTGFPDPDGCPAGEFVTTIGATITCAAPAAALGLTGGEANKVAFWTSGSALSRNINFHWDNAAGRLGIGTATPEFTLDVRGSRAIVRSAGNAEIDLQSGTDTHWGIYSELASDELRFWRGADRLSLSADGNLAITGGATVGADVSATNLIASTQVRTPSLCLGADCRMAWPAAGGGGGAMAETDPLYTVWYNGGNPTVTGALTVGTDLRVNALYSRTAGADTIWLGDTDDTIRVQGAVSVGGCFGPVVVGVTPLTYNGNLNGAGAPNDGYRGVDGLCNAAFTEAHQCATNEVMTSIHCGSIWTSAAKTTLQGYVPPGAFVWISNGAPSLPTPTNDCYGWTETGVIGGEQSQGVAWFFDAPGGAGYARPCSDTNRILCCR